MSPLVPSALANSGKMMEVPPGTASVGGPNVFSKVQERTGSEYELAPPQLIRQQSSAGPAPFLSASSGSADALKPKFEYVGDSLSALNRRASALEPADAA